MAIAKVAESAATTPGFTLDERITALSAAELLSSETSLETA